MLMDAGHDAACVADVGRRSAPDFDINSFAIEDGRVIVTRDLDFPLRDQPRPPGLILLRMRDDDGREAIFTLLRNLISDPVFESAYGSIIVASPPERFRSRLIEDA